YMMLAKIYLLERNYEDAEKCCDIIIESKKYNSGSIVWGGYTNVTSEPIETINSLTYDEVSLMKSITSLKLGKDSGYTTSELMQNAQNVLQGTGQLYPYARILEGSFDVPGFDAIKNRLLPIPMRALETYPTLKQNEGY
ncbi:hypothetical protein, partial [Bacteroides caecigallinarum]|uniref:hypothetical protein n=1 Tax=Bacteroides caecigallinarum TaxID=1411144 RepID=UPI001F26A53E